MPDSHAGNGKKGAAKVHSAQGALIVDPTAGGKPADATGAFLDVHGEKPMSDEPGGEASAMATAAIGRAKTKGSGAK